MKKADLEKLHGGFQVKTIVKESSLSGAGLGVFVDEEIQKDTIIWIEDSKYTNCFSEKEIETWTEAQQEKLYSDDLVWYKPNGDLCVTAEKSSFINHSRNPNIYYVEHKILGFMIASAKKINAGEELFDDYRRYTPENERPEWC